MSLPTRPRPVPTAESGAFWDGLRAHTLLMPWCADCGRFGPLGPPWCPRRLRPHAWREVSGRGTVHSYTRVHRPFVPGFAVPYVVVEVELAEQAGLLLTSTFRGGAGPGIGDPVTAEFVDDPRGFTVHQFRADIAVTNEGTSP